MTDLDTTLRFNAVNGEARDLGYRIAVDLVTTTPGRYMAYAHSVTGQPSVGKFLCSSDSSAIEAAEDGLEILRGVVERDAQWPEER